MIGDYETLVQYAVKAWALEKVIVIQWQTASQRFINAEACSNTSLKNFKAKLAGIMDANPDVMFQLDIVYSFEWSVIL